ncbi:hypothetical protein Gpo141_00010776 [Globisporangium polare]
MQIFAPRFLSAAALLLASAISATQALNVQMHGINYNSRIGPDWAPDATRCKTSAQIEQDMLTIKKMSDSVRIYSLQDCKQGLPVAKAARKAGLKLALGIWTTANVADLNNELARLGELIDAGYLDDNISGFHVGSEALYRKDVDITTALSYLNTVRTYLSDRGIKIPLTVADVVDSYTQYPELVDAVDYISINQFSFWEKADISEGTPTMLDRIKPLRVIAANKGKKVVIGETGWSSQGYDPTKASIASPENQARYFKDFYEMAAAHGFDYYWFMAFDSKWRVDNGDDEIEGYFGVYQEDQTLKANFASLTVNTRVPKAVRSVGSKLLLTQSDNTLSMTSDASGSSEWLKAEQQTWFYDAATSTLRSKGNDRCLDTYQPYDAGEVRLYACIDNEKNQKWVYDAATGRLNHGTYTAFCLDTDPTQGNKLQIYGCSAGNKNQQWTLETPGQGDSSTTPTVTPAPTSTPAPSPETPAPASDGSVRFFTKESLSKQYVQLVRVGEEIGLGYGTSGVANSEWWYNPGNNLVQNKDSNYCLDAYEAWDGGRVHVWACNANEANQQWTMDASTGQLKHLTHAGFCLDADQSTGKVSLYWCHLDNNNQVWRKVSNVAKGVVIQSATSTGAVLEPTTQDTVVGLAASNSDGQQWFWDAAAKRFVSKWRNECLDAYEAWEGGRVHTYQCIDGEGNQTWTYDANTNSLKHAKHTGFCLAFNDMNSKLLQLKACRSDDATQRIKVTTN